MNSRTFLAILAVVCFVAFVNAQQSADPLASIQSKASDIAASATSTTAPSPTEQNAAVSLASGSIFMQLVILACAMVASSYLV